MSLALSFKGQFFGQIVVDVLSTEVPGRRKNDSAGFSLRRIPPL
jgi:hypothetical protein